MMKILQLTNKNPWPPKDGEAIAILTMSKGFFLLGHQVTVLTMNVEGSTELEEIPEQLTNQICIKRIDVKRRFCRKSFYPRLRNIGINEDFEKALTELLREENFDVIQIETLYLCQYIPLIRRFSNALVSYRVHNIEHEMLQRSYKNAGFMSYLLTKPVKKLERSILNTYDVLITITEHDGISLDRLGNKKPRFTSEVGIDLSNLVPTAKDLEYPSLFHIGALDWPPNQEGLVWFLNSCWPAIHKQFPDLKFYIAGRSGPSWIKMRFGSEHVIFLGEVEDAYQFMNSKAIMVVPLHSDSGMRIKIIEGMALGKAIVSTKTGCEGIPVVNRENILIADQPEEFLEAIKDLITNYELFDLICQNSVNFISGKYNYLTIVERLAHFYETSNKS